jgi:hypothetical protein
LSKACCGKKGEAAENGYSFQLQSIFQRSATHSRFAHATHQAVAIKAGVLCAFVKFPYSSLHCFGGSVDFKNLVKTKSVP